MKSKSFVALFLLVTFFSVIITAPVYAVTKQQSPVFAAKQMPTWLAEAEAVTVSDVELAEVQGEVIWIPIMAGLSLAMITYLYYKWVTDPKWVTNNPAAGDLFIQLHTP